MSSQTPFNQLEREYYVRKSGGALNTTSLNNIKKAYFISQVGTVATNESMDSLERRWLQKLVATSGQIPAADFSELWKQAVLSINQVPRPMMTQNKRTFFSTAP